MEQKKPDEAVVVIWMPMLKKLLETDHQCPCYPEILGLCPCRPFIEKLDCRCGLFIVKEAYVYDKEKAKAERIEVHA